MQAPAFAGLPEQTEALSPARVGRYRVRVTAAWPPIAIN
jgi:hypothetical protein